MLLTKTVTVTWRNKTMKHYIDKGYVYTKQNDLFDVNVEDLPNGSHILVDVKCDCENCENPYLSPMKWNNYKQYIKDDGKYYCSNCARKLYGGERARLTILKTHGKTFKMWCIENGRRDVVNRWDYELNKLSPDEIGYCSGKKYWFKCPCEKHESELKGIEHLVSGRGDSFGCNKCNSFAEHGLKELGGSFFSEYWSNTNTIDPFSISHCSLKRVIIKCKKHGDYEISCNDFSRGHRCQLCGKEKSKGENNGRWRGGVTSLNNYLRTNTLQWKKDTMKLCNFKCVITGERFDIIHHLYGFDQIIKETLSITGLPIYEEINMYSSEELDTLTKVCNELHYKYGLGVCLTKEIHEKFHSIYGYGNNTPEQFEEFMKNNIYN